MTKAELIEYLEKELICDQSSINKIFLEPTSEYNVGILPKYLIDAATIEKHERELLRERLSGIYDG